MPENRRVPPATISVRRHPSVGFSHHGHDRAGLWRAALVVIIVLLAGCDGDSGEGSTTEVTAAQYRAAVEDTRACMSDAGFEVSDIRDGSAGVLLSFGWESKEGALAAYDSCYQEHLQEIEHYWFHLNVPTGAKREHMMEELRGCLAEGGLDVTAIPMTDDLAELLVSIQEQVSDESDEFAVALLCIDDYRLLYPEGVLPL